jgi:hypothetical protein
MWTMESRPPGRSVSDREGHERTIPESRSIDCPNIWDGQIDDGVTMIYGRFYMCSAMSSLWQSRSSFYSVERTRTVI